MTGILLGAQTVVTVRPGSFKDSYGNDTPDWGNAIRTTVRGCSLQPLAGAELLPVGRDAVETSWQLIAPPGDLQATDRIESDGVTYEVDGEVQRWFTPWGTLDHIQAHLKVVRG